MNFKVSNSRSVVKAITFRVIILIVNTIVIYLITRRIDLTAGLVIATNLSSTVLYFFHERAWNKVSWGRNGSPDNNEFHAPV